MQFDQRKRRREFIMQLGGMAVFSVAWPLTVHAQQGERMQYLVKRKIDRFVSAEMLRQKIPGMAVAVVKSGEVVLATPVDIEPMKKRRLRMRRHSWPASSGHRQLGQRIIDSTIRLAFWQDSRKSPDRR